MKYKTTLFIAYIITGSITAGLLINTLGWKGAIIYFTTYLTVLMIIESKIYDPRK